MLNAAATPNAFKTTGRKGFYIGTAKSTIRNKKRAWRLAADGSRKIYNFFQPLPNTTAGNFDYFYYDQVKILMIFLTR